MPIEDCHLISFPICVCSNAQVDVWSMGVIYYQMLYGKRPFGEGMTQEALARQGVLLNASQVCVCVRARVCVSVCCFCVL